MSHERWLGGHALVIGDGRRWESVTQHRFQSLLQRWYVVLKRIQSDPSMTRAIVSMGDAIPHADDAPHTRKRGDR